MGTRAAASSQATEEALRHAEARALYQGGEHEPFIRHGHDAAGKVLYLDMCDNDWRAIRIAAGGWEIVTDPAVKFIRSDHMQSLPIPERPAPQTDLGAQLYEDIGALVPLVSEGAITMILSWLVMNFHPGDPFPILDLYGVDGSAKTSTARHIKRFTDPDDLQDRSPPRRARPVRDGAQRLDRLYRQPVFPRCLAQRLHVPARHRRGHQRPLRSTPTPMSSGIG